MTATPLHTIEQAGGFTFDSMDFAMSRSSACLIQVNSNTPTLEDWADGDVDKDLDNGDEEDHGDGDVDKVADDDDEFEQYLHGDNDD